MWICINSHDQGNSQTDWLTVRSGHGILIYSAWQVLNYHLLSPYLELCWCYWYKQPHLYYLFTVICLFPALLLIYHQHEEKRAKLSNFQPTIQRWFLCCGSLFMHQWFLYVPFVLSLFVLHLFLFWWLQKAALQELWLRHFLGIFTHIFLLEMHLKDIDACLKNLNSNC